MQQLQQNVSTSVIYIVILNTENRNNNLEPLSPIWSITILVLYYFCYFVLSLAEQEMSQKLHSSILDQMQRVDTLLHNNILLSLLLSNTNASVGNHYRRSRIFVFMFIPSILQELKQNIEKRCILFVVHKNTKLIINFLIKFYVIVFLFL